MKKYIYMGLLLPGILIEGCLGHFVAKEHSNIYQLSGVTGKIPLDKTKYKLYVRKGYALNNLLINRKILYPGANTAISRQDTSSLAITAYKNAISNLSAPFAGLKLIEIEYLFISRTGDNVLYISTLADRYQTRYNNLAFPGTDHPNAADFRVFLFGRLDPSDHNRIIFYGKDNKHDDVWTIKRQKSSDIGLHMIEQKRFSALEDVFLLDDALGVPMVFEPVNSSNDWQLVYTRNPGQTATESPTDPQIKVAGTKRRFVLQIDFDQHHITYANNYVIYDPSRCY